MVGRQERAEGCFELIDETAFKQARLFVVVADEAELTSIIEVLETAEFREIESTSEPAKAVAMLAKFGPDLIVLDLDTPGGDGLEVLQRLKLAVPGGVSLPILGLTSDEDPTARRRALIEGANDVLLKPLDATDMLAAFRNLLEIRFLSLQLAGGSKLDALVDQVARQRTQALEQQQLELLMRFAQATEFRATERGVHAEGVQMMSMMLARVLGLPDDQAKLIGKAALLHDIGRVGVSHEVLDKPGRLTQEEYEEVKAHAKIGGELLADANSPLLWLAEQVARYHHERWDGTGYEGLSGDQIPVAARIVAVADAFDALTHDRPYRKALAVEKAIEEIKAERGHQFDPTVVDAFLGMQTTGID